jgi:hypothetical protein
MRLKPVPRFKLKCRDELGMGKRRWILERVDIDQCNCFSLAIGVVFLAKKSLQ